TIAAIDLRHFERPVRVIRHLKPVRRIEQEGDRRVRHPTIRVFLCKAHKLIRDPPEWIELERMLAWPRLEKLIETLLEIGRRRSRHVVKVITLPIPGQRRTHRLPVARMEKVNGAGKVLRVR